MNSDSTLSTFTAGDGENLAVQDWPIQGEQALRGVVLIVHGLGEHAGRYDRLATQLNEWGFGVRGYDQFGHGDSGGPRGGLNSEARLLEDLSDLIDSTRARMPRDLPLIVLGHSMGGLVAARHVALRLRALDGLILSSPAFDAGLSRVQKALVSVLPRFLPNLRVSNGLKPAYLSHDPQVVKAYVADPLCHKMISARLARFIADTGPLTVEAASRWRVPTLLMWAGSDRLVNPAGSRAFAAAAPSCVESIEFPDLYHELFNELQAEPVYQRLSEWLDKHFANLP
jgi:alpha-beta hydrolase superfamily lysophospholipase